MEGSFLPSQPGPDSGGGPRSLVQRKELLARTLTFQIAGGARIESQSDFQAVVVHGKRVNHTLHLILTLVTFGFWGIAWIALAIIGGEKRSIVAVDEYGNASVQKV